MTEQELVDQMVTLTATARAVLQSIQSYGTVNGDVTISAGGFSITLPSVAKQADTFAAQFATDRLNFHKDFGGTPAGVIITRDGAGNIASIVTTFASGWSLTKTYTRFASGALLGRMQTIGYTLKDALAVTQATGTRTLNYDASNRLASIS